MPVVEGVTPGNINVVLNIVNWVPDSVMVSVSNVPLQTPFGIVTLNAKPATTFPYVGAWMAPRPGK